MTTTGTPTAPQLSTDQLRRLTAYGDPGEVVPGDVVFAPGDTGYDLVVLESGRVEITSPATGDQPESPIAEYGAGSFLGELNLLTGQVVYVTARVVEAGRVHRVPPARFRRLMAEDADVADVLLRTLMARRKALRTGVAARAVEIIGSQLSAGSHALRTYAARQRIAHLWFDAETVAGQALMAATPLAAGDLPAVVVGGRVLRRATPGELADVLGLSYRALSGDPVDLAVVGSGPAGLAAAFYGASEGLRTVLLDAVGTGGQAAASSRIENYLGFPSGLSGVELTQRAALQALKFGAQLSSPCEVVELDTGGTQLRLVLRDGTEVLARSVVLATGARYRGLPLDRWADFEGAGIYYAATELEARACSHAPLTVVGGANSAGQAALFLASRGAPVTLAVRGPDLTAGMSAYLVDRVLAHPRITVATGTQVTALGGGDSLESVTLTPRDGGPSREQACVGLFCFIGAEPATDWLGGVAVDGDGFVLTDVDLPAGPDPTWTALGREPLPFETSVPGVFAAGDVRHGSMKRVAAAVGEGASAVRSVHAAIGAHV
ncbi:FAD-dependent oxidoreductase [Klenkia terrae]